MKISNFLFVCICFTALLSCTESTNPEDYVRSEKTSSIFDYKNYLGGEGTYYKERGVLYRTVEEYDILPISDVIIGRPYSFNFYNYNGELQINKMLRPNIYVNAISSEFHLVVIDNYNNIQHYKTSYSGEYGEWGTATVSIGQMFVKDVIVTPLAARFLANRNTKGCLVFVRFEQNFGKKYKDYLFYGGIRTEMIINDYYEMINRTPSFSIKDDTDDWKTKMK